MVPVGTKKPVDKRIVTGNYIKNRGPKDKTDGYARMMALLCREVRSDLDAIIGYSNLMKESQTLIPNGLENILAASDSCLSAIQSVSAWENMRDKSCKRKAYSVAVREFLKSITDNMKPHFQSRNIQFLCLFTISGLKILEDKERYELIIRNLLGCVAKEAHAGSTITFKVDVLPEDGSGEIRLRYTIEGNGGGLTEESIQYEVTKLLVKDLNGELEVDYDPKQGTKITLILSHKKAEKKTDTIKTTSDSSLAGKRVLLVEDNQFSMEVTRVLLEKEGMVVDTAEDGIIAVAKVRMAEKNYYDFILSDFMMPNMDGLTAASIIRNLDDHDKASIPIFIMTSTASDFRKLELDITHIRGIIEKPVDKNKLLKLLRKG